MICKTVILLLLSSNNAVIETVSRKNIAREYSGIVENGNRLCYETHGTCAYVIIKRPPEEYLYLCVDKESNPI